MSTAPPATPAGASSPPAPDTKATADALVKSLLPVIEGWEKIDAKETRDMLTRLLDEKTAQGPLQGNWTIADELLARAHQEWSLPNGDPYTPLIAACLAVGERPVPTTPTTTTPAAAQPTQSPTTQQPAVALTWGNFPASLPEVTETTATISDNKEVGRQAMTGGAAWQPPERRRAPAGGGRVVPEPPAPSSATRVVRTRGTPVAHLETATKRARRLAVVAFVVAVISSALGLIVNLVRWIATSPSWVVAIITAVGAFIIGVFASGRVADWFKKRR